MLCIVKIRKLFKFLDDIYCLCECGKIFEILVSVFKN